VNLEAEHKVAADAAQQAGAMLSACFARSASGVRCKGGDPRELVSDADLAADEMIRAILETTFPNDSVLSEERPSLSADSNAHRRWVVDPLDGTTNFVAGIPCWAISIGLQQGGETALATVYDPVRDELFQSTMDGATLNGTAIGVSTVEDVRSSVLALLLSPSDLAEPELVALAEHARATRVFGATALELAWVASGRLDGCLFRRNASVWDWAAGERLVIDAGGVSVPLPGPLANARFAAGPTLAQVICGGKR
jgi:myo-inositol-1(or 4)-monophosphatase